MRRALVLLLPMLLLACGGNEDGRVTVDQISRKPLSVRGWILDIKDAKKSDTYEMEIARRHEIFLASSIWVEDSPYASGGLAENGAFIVLDVPPGNAILGFNAPGAEDARIVLENIPGSADVFIPDVILEPGGAKVADPSKISIRIAANVKAPRATGQTARVAGYDVPVWEAPVSELMNRREYPDPGVLRPVATVK